MRADDFYRPVRTPPSATTVIVHLTRPLAPGRSVCECFERSAAHKPVIMCPRGMTAHLALQALAARKSTGLKIRTRTTDL